MRKASLWLLVFVTLILQASLFSKIEVFGVRPDPTVIVLVYIALGLGSIAGSLFGFLIGLAQFAIMSSSMASVPLAATTVGFVVGRYGTKVMHESYIVQILILFLAFLMFDIINFACSSPGQMPGILFRFSLIGGLYTAVVGVVLAIVIEKIVGLRLVA